jgi:Transmembrane protein 43
MFQWNETTREENNQRIRTYKIDWSPSIIDSSGFFDKKYVNPRKSFVYNNAKHSAKEVLLGGFTLSQGQIDRINHSEAVVISDEDLIEIKIATDGFLAKNGYGGFVKEGKYLLARFFINGGIPNSTGYQPGDIRISFSHVPCAPCSVLAEQL